MFDVICPKDAKALVKFEEIALRLGIDTLYIVGDFELKSDKIKMIKAGERKASFIIKKADGVNDRKWLQNRDVDLVYGLEGVARKDGVHHRYSGLNQIMCKVARDANTMIGFDFGAVLHAKGVRRAQLLGRIEQNIRLCKKYKVECCWVSLADEWFEMINLEESL
ncbi:hypothetical protein HN419_01865 [Candidatus Woesearchaeota archaeon]|jgi:hypothetical protein|nr:hypothetical protein [Candidatus Woesearchaeota archaeon]MBT3537257.1 hypothetical protein [Candidatus Woesearchaeota archaeon]MBT4698396.1 hypothetical protein [Candidatus Woesearchaeota archaeon]MBT7106433.1 hypothetical protein [Candidatus Woesearchaeota archaeon]MBT7931192.1 hypothetical protein [Candidatus Woesearchaeota archaeon]